MSLNEVAPPGFGHTKGDKEKGVKKGGTAAAFDKARKEGRFKGSKSDMFAIMWAQKNKGDKPHYKPGTGKKYKKYQEDWKPEIEHIKGSDLRKKAAEKKRKEAESSLPPHLKLDAMKKAFASTNEEVDMPNVDKKDRGAIKKRFKGLFKKDVKGTVSSVNESENISGISLEPYTPDIKFREYEFIDIIKPEPLKGTVSEANGCSDDYENLKKKVGSKKKHDKPAITFKEFKDINNYT